MRTKYRYAVITATLSMMSQMIIYAGIKDLEIPFVGVVLFCAFISCICFILALLATED